MHVNSVSTESILNHTHMTNILRESRAFHTPMSRASAHQGDSPTRGEGHCPGPPSLSQPMHPVNRSLGPRARAALARAAPAAPRPAPGAPGACQGDDKWSNRQPKPIPGPSSVTTSSRTPLQSDALYALRSAQRRRADRDSTTLECACSRPFR